jgi:hypothetical protein
LKIRKKKEKRKANEKITSTVSIVERRQRKKTRTNMKASTVDDAPVK